MIGHTKNAAGVAGLIKAALALYCKVLPPTLGVSKPNAAVSSSEGPFYVNTELRPWIKSTNEHPRRAGVSAFGFGGTNFHVVLEEYTDDYLRKESEPRAVLPQWQSELILIPGNSRQEILKSIEPIEKVLSQGAKPRLRDLAYTLSKLDEQQTRSEGRTEACSKLRLAIIATSLEDLQQKLARAREVLTKSDAGPSANNLEINEPRGIYFSEQPLLREGKVAFLFPGQGSQYINMLKDLTIEFPEVRICFERANRILQHQLSKPLSSYIFPPPAFSQEEESAQKQALTQTNVAQPTVGAADMAMFHLLEALGVHPDFVAGHSCGEYPALCAASVFSEEALIALLEARGRFIVEAAGKEPSTMAAVHARTQTVAEFLEGIKGVRIANLNAPEQTVISGPLSGVQEALDKFKAQGIRAQLIPVACAFHSPIVALACDRLTQFLSNVELAEPQVEVFSNTTASAYPREPKAIADLLIQHLVSPVKFVQEIEALYEAGARIFVEVGPRAVLTELAGQILKDRRYLAVPSDRIRRPGLLQLHHLLGQLAAQGVPIKLARLYQGREVRQVDLSALEKDTGQEEPARTAWLVNGSRAIPLTEVPTSHSGQVKPVRLVVADDRVPFGHATASVKSQQQPAPENLTSTTLETASQPGSPLVESNKRMAEPSALHPSSDENAQVMAQFQQIMNRFLDTQERVMRAYLQATSEAQGRHDSAQDLAPATSQEAVLQEPPVAQAKATPALTMDKEPSPVLSESLPKHEELTSHLLEIVSERTGYPLEMLDLDLDLEADLGIDSIKRVEILGNFQEKYAWTNEQNMEQAMEELAGLKTLRQIIDWIETCLKSMWEKEKAEPEFKESSLDSDASQVTVPETPEDNTIQRFTLTAVEKPLTGQHGGLSPHSVLVLTDDETGVAQALAEELRALSYPVALIRMGEDFRFQVSDFGAYTVNLASPGAVDQALNVIRQRQGAIGGLVHLLPLKSGMPFEKMDLTSWKERLRLEVKSLFYLAKSLREDLKQASQRSGACLVAATRMGGTFSSVSQSGMATETEEFLPSQGSVTGLLKTIAVEWPEVRVKAVDLNFLESPSALASKLLQEMTAQDGQVELGYRDSQRMVLQPAPSPLDKEAPAALNIDSSWVILVTGGARGITADVACELARRYQPTLVLVGRSPLPDSEEAEETTGLEERELKAVLTARMRREGQPVKPAQVEAAYMRLLKDREMRNNMTAMRSHGAKVQYYQVDVHDEEQFGNIIDEIYKSYGRLDGVIHGAGIIEDKLVGDKSPESFDRVFDTKVESAFVLSRKLRPDSLKFLVFFSSVAGRFGNRGQCDYTAANEVYNKLAIYLDKRWPGRVVSVMWSPWARSGGMVSPELQKQFAKAGIVLVPRLVGPRKLDEELRYGRKGEAEVIIGGYQMEKGKQEADELFRQVGKADKEDTSPLSFPLVGSRASVTRGAVGSVEIVRYLDPAQDLYLRDHQLDGKPVLPMAIALELIAETVALGWPKLELAVVRDMRILQGIVVEHGSKPIRVTAKPRAGPSLEQLAVEVSISGADDQRQVHYQAIAELVKQLPPPAKIKPFTVAEARSFQMSVQEAYHKWLFHGPLLQRIDQIERIGTNGITGSLVPSSPQQCIAEATGQWLIDPMVIDGGLQLSLIWCRLYRDMTLLPSRFRAYRRFGSLSGSKINCQVNVRSSPNSPVIRADLAFLGAEGRLLGLLEDIEGTCSKALNRLAGGHLI